MNRRALVPVAMALLAVLAVVAIGGYAYRAGVVQGLGDSGKLPAMATPYGYHGPFWHGPFFFGGPLFFVLFVFLFFGLVRRVLWGRGGWRDHYGACGYGAPPPFEEWHRKAHESMEQSKPRT